MRHQLVFPMSATGFLAVCTTCGWRGPDRSLKAQAWADGSDHLTKVYKQREPMWSPYP